MPTEQRRILIYCKTYPELSQKHVETVYTAGVDVSDGRPIRLFPVPLRYLPEASRYQLYDVVEVPVSKNGADARPESYKIEARHLRRVDHLTPADDWEARRQVIFRNEDWHYPCLERLKERQRQDHSSLGSVPFGSVEWVKLAERDEEDRRRHDEQVRARAAVLSLFEEPVRRQLDFLPFRVRVGWRCGAPGRLAAGCPGHTGSVFDWGLLDLGRRDGPEAALARMRQLCDLRRYDLRFFMGNLFTRQHIFVIVGMWYPPRRDQMSLCSAW